MTQAGWYPDPAGQPQTYRYWDGSSWSQETTGDPYAPPPVPPPPPPPPAPAGYGQAPGFPPAYGATGAARRSRGPALMIALAAVGVLALVGLSVAGFLVLRAADGDDDSGAGGSATVSSSDAPTDATGTTGATGPTDPTGSTGTTGTTAAPTDQQCKGGRPEPSAPPSDGARRVSGGGLTIPVPAGYTADIAYAAPFTFADGFTPLQKVIEQNEQSGWVSIYGVGALPKSNGFTDPAQAAEAVMACMAQSPDLYAGFTGREEVSAGELTVDGSAAYQVTAELRVDDPNLSVEGDVAQVVVVDTGDPETFGLYLTVVPIGDQELIDQQAAFVGRLTTS